VLPLKISGRGFSDSFPKGKDAEAFLDTSQGDVEGVAFLGLMKDAFQAEIEEVQFIQERVLVGPAVVVIDGSQGAAQMLAVAGERGNGEFVLGGQGTQRPPGHQAAVDLGAFFVSADSAAFIHGSSFAPMK